MKAFWAVLAALLVCGGVYVAMAARAGAQHAEQTEQTAALQAQAEALKAEQQRQSAEAASAQLEALKKVQDEVAANVAASKEEIARLQKVEEASKTAGSQAADPGPRPDGTKPEPVMPEAPKPVTQEKKEVEQPKPVSNSGFSISDGSIAPVGVTGTPTTPGAPQAVVATVKQDKPATFQGFEVVPAKIEKKEDGSQLIDGKYLIKGEGTAEKPYVVPWEVLTSVEETFDPQAAKKRLPERVTMLDGKVVKFAGYIAFPLMMKETKECLSMLNQWDGCCIGVPPTPYDAVEVALSRTIKGEERFTTSGVVTGVFRVKPYLQGDWLIGLYVMEGGDLKSRDFGGTAGN